METKLILEIKYDCENDIDAVEMIKTEIFDNLSSVIGDGEVFINEISIETSDSKIKEKKIKKPEKHQCNINDVRQLLIDFCEIYAEGQFEDPDDTEGIVDWYLKVKDN